MAYKTKWLYPDRIAHVIFSDVVNIEDVSAAYQETHQRIAGNSLMVHMVIDTLAVTKLDLSLPELVAVMRRSKSNVGWRILITQNRTIRMFSSIAFQAVGMRFRFVASHEEAINFLIGNDDSLGLLKQEAKENENAL